MKTFIPGIVTMIFISALVTTSVAQQPPEEGDEPVPVVVPPPEEILQQEEPTNTVTPGQEENGAAQNAVTAPAGIKEPVVIKPSQEFGSNVEVPQSQFMPPEESTGTNSNEIRLNFRNAPLEMVLNYLSDAAGFIIVLDTQVRGNITVMSTHPITKDEAVDLLNSALNKNGYAAIRSGRTLTILDKSTAKTRDIPVKVSNDPNEIPKNDEIVTQIIPVRFVEARQLVTDLSSFVSPQATVVANEAGNSIVVTDTQANIRHLAEIIRAIDNSAEGETEIRVFRLAYANPTDVATLLGEIFPANNSTGGQNQTPIRFGGRFGGFPGFPFGGGRGNTGNASTGSQNERLQKATQVIASADLRTSSVVVTASKDLMQQIEGIVRELDVKSPRDQNVYVFHMENGDPQQAVQVLQNMFQSSTTTRNGTSSSSSQNSALMQRQQNNASSGSSTVSGSSSSGFGNTQGSPGGNRQF